MNEILVNLTTYDEDFVRQINFNNLSFEYQGITTNFSNNNASNFTIKIYGNVEINELENLFFILYELLYLLTGRFFYIQNTSENINLSESVIHHWKSDKNFIVPRNYNFDFSKTINSEHINNYINLRSTVFAGYNTLYYLQSNKYKDILIDHRLSLLLFFIDGYTKNNNKYHCKDNNCRKEKESKDCCIYKFRLEHFIDSSLISGVDLEFLGYKSISDLADGLKNMRVQYAHITNKKLKNNTMRNDYFYYFGLILTLCRYRILEDIGINIEDSIIESMATFIDCKKYNDKKALSSSEKAYKELNFNSEFYKLKKHNFLQIENIKSLLNKQKTCP